MGKRISTPILTYLLSGVKSEFFWVTTDTVVIHLGLNSNLVGHQLHLK